MAQPGDFAYTVKNAVDIVRVVGEYVRLKRASGSRYTGLCPFHQEKTPSFSVNGQFQFYYCFGCKATGDVFKFVMEMDRLTFPEAVRAVAEKAGIPVPKYTSPDTDPQAKLRSQIFEIHERAAGFYRRQLELPDGAPARQYLLQRGMAAELVREFGLGFAPAGGQALTRLLAKDFPEEALTASGLLLKRDDGSGLFDRFRFRLMFPIQNESGKVIAFGGRALREEDQPKYLNSPETPIYRKSRVLYSLHRAREPMRKQGRAVLVEGYMDAIGVYSAGVANVVASCGTSLTLEHVKALSPLVKTVVVNYDADAAGVAATERSLATLLEEKLEVRILALPAGQDPDDYVKAAGPEAYRQQLEAAPPFFDYLVSRVPQMFDMARPEGKAAAARHLLGYITKLPDRIVRVAMAERLAGSLGLDRDLLGKELRSAAAERSAGRTLGAARGAGLSQIEKAMLRLLLLEPQARQQVLPPLLEELTRLETLPSRAIFQTLGAMTAAGETVIDVAALEDRLEEGDRERLAQALNDEEVEPIDTERALAFVDDLRRRALQTDVDHLRQQIKAAEAAGDMKEAVRLLEQKKALERRVAG